MKSSLVAQLVKCLSAMLETQVQSLGQEATYSSVLACRIPGKGEPGGLPSVGSYRVDLAAVAAAATNV